MSHDPTGHDRGQSPRPDKRADSPSKPRHKASVGAFVSHILRMPKLHKMLLTLAMLMLGAGAAGQVAARVAQRPDPATSSSTLVADQPAWQRHAPAMTRTGAGFIIAFVVGWISRIFVKTMALVASAGAAIFVGLSYFNVFNLDLSKAEKHYQSGVAWVSDQGERVTKSLMSHAPASASTVLGVFCGFKRKK
jgi:uncharacterized membrane protein (Fun14 family)